MLVSGAVVVDHRVAGGPVQPGDRVVDAFERAGGDAAHDHVLGDVGSDLSVVDPCGDEGS